MKLELKNYQKRIVEFCKTTDKVILSVGMGLGKTAAVLHYIDEIKPESVLIVAPKRVAETVWMQEAEKWGLSSIAEKMIIVSGTKKQREKAIADAMKPYKIIGRDNVKDIVGCKVDVLVLDELTSFKSHDSKRSKIIYGITARQRIGLTGTFLANGALDIWGQARAVGLFTARNQNFYAWRATYFYNALEGSGLQWQKWVMRKGLLLDDILKPIRKNIFTLDSADYLEIPKVSFVPHQIRMTPVEYEEYMCLNTMLHVQLDGLMVSVKEQAKFAKLQTLCNGFIYDEEGKAIRGAKSTKLDEVTDFCERAVGEGEQILLFYAYVEEAKWLAEKFDKSGLRYCSPKDKRFIEKWENGDIDVLIAHPASAGHGLNLQHGGRIIVWSSITWNYEFWEQANARLIRQGQENKVQVHTFMMCGTVEEQQFLAVRKKDKGQREFLELTKQ